MLRKYMLLFVSFLFYSFAVVFGKLASSNEPFSLMFILFYGMQILFLGLYAVFWQFSLKKLNLSVAYPLKSITIVIGMCLGALIFHESIHFMQLVAVSLIFLGVFMVSDYE